MLIEMSQKVVIVTGGCQGIGRGIATRFLAEGAEVVICARHPPAAPVSSGDRTATFIAADVREPDQVEAVVKGTLERLGKIDVLVNNAGGSPPADAATASPRFSASIINLNLVAPLVFAQQVNAVMQRQGEGGVIVNIASVSAIRPSPGTAAYGAAKAGLISLTQSLAVEWAPKVRINAVVAGIIRTEKAHLHYGDEAAMERVAKTIPLGRMGDPDDIADTCLYLASPLARYVTGACLTVHGGGEAPAFLGAARPSKP
jgi:NAD(P)-dependent dehydrogenase (short-subunit alcohol dehydrogenase family)